jgi:AbiV family abortive infection protein
MANSRNTIDKIDRLAGVCLDNAIRLHHDSIRLFQLKSFASALAFSILAMEELAKAFMYEDIVWHARLDDAPIDSSLDFSRKYLQSHRVKQRIFANQASRPKWIFKNGEAVAGGNAFWKLADSDSLEGLKQRALYAGLTGTGKKGGISRISNPLKIKQRHSKRMITILNDYLLDLIIGVRRGWYAVDAVSMQEKLHRRLLKRLKEIWPHRGQAGVRAISLDAKSKAA